MHVARPDVKLWTKVWGYRSIVLLHHIPTNLIVSVLTSAMRRDMALPMRMERFLTSSGVKLTYGPVMSNVDQRALLVSVLCTDVHLFLWNTLANGV